MCSAFALVVSVVTRVVSPFLCSGALNLRTPLAPSVTVVAPFGKPTRVLEVVENVRVCPLSARPW